MGRDPHIRRPPLQSALSMVALPEPLTSHPSHRCLDPLLTRADKQWGILQVRLPMLLRKEKQVRSSRGQQQSCLARRFHACLTSELKEVDVLPVLNSPYEDTSNGSLYQRRRCPHEHSCWNSD